MAAEHYLYIDWTLRALTQKRYQCIDCALRPPNLQPSTFNFPPPMAQPIPLELPARDPRAELQARLQNAPLDHAQALMAAYEVLQGLHDRGVFEMLRGALGSTNNV